MSSRTVTALAASDQKRTPPSLQHIIDGMKKKTRLWDLAIANHPPPSRFYPHSPLSSRQQFRLGNIAPPIRHRLYTGLIRHQMSRGVRVGVRVGVTSSGKRLLYIIGRFRVCGGVRAEAYLGGGRGEWLPILETETVEDLRG